ncbi:transcription elongation factor GreB [Stagnimonas aquatica]|uniref:Transcription elongation factor GreB n=1 Tax=Stagnimonas aquatica TaxID=2689987 RepID=A0A3N0V8G4_9GAMM|nr:transcription elongation factor GreB [Stagnimonas aquatica]ROH89009.1 transcription elongation factor GreB [Stagnimonas aquatica]
MSRWRPPNPEVASVHITRAGYDKLKAEYEHLWRERRPEVVRALAAAAAEGDRSENAEYIYRKKELREIDRRVGYLQRRLPDLKIVESQPTDRSRIYFGALVELVDEDGAERVYRIVGGDETDAATGAISIDSPLAKALLKKQEGEVVRVQLPGGEVELEIVAVRYP